MADMTDKIGILKELERRGLANDPRLQELKRRIIPSYEPEPITPKTRTFGTAVKENLSPIGIAKNTPGIGVIASSGEAIQATQAKNRLDTIPGNYEIEESQPSTYTGPTPSMPIRVKHTRATDQKIVDTFIQNQTATSSGPATAVDIVAQAPGFAAEFAVTGGVGSAVRQGLVKGGAKYILGRMKGGIARTLAKRTINAAGWAGAGVVQGTLMPQRTAETLLQNEASQAVGLSEKASPAKNLMRSYVDTIIQAGSERAGADLFKLPGAGKFVSETLNKLPFAGKVMPKIAAAWAKATGNPVSAFMGRVAQKGGFDGVLEEVGEERLATVMSAVLNDQDFGADQKLGREANWKERLEEGLTQDLERLPAEFAAFSVVPGGRAAVGAIANRIASKPGQVVPQEVPTPTIPLTPDQAKAAVDNRIRNILAAGQLGADVTRQAGQVADAEEAARGRYGQVNDLLSNLKESLKDTPEGQMLQNLQDAGEAPEVITKEYTQDAFQKAMDRLREKGLADLKKGTENAVLEDVQGRQEEAAQVEPPAAKTAPDQPPAVTEAEVPAAGALPTTEDPRPFEKYRAALTNATEREVIDMAIEDGIDVPMYVLNPYRGEDWARNLIEDKRIKAASLRGKTTADQKITVEQPEPAVEQPEPTASEPLQSGAVGEQAAPVYRDEVVDMGGGSGVMHPLYGISPKGTKIGKLVANPITGQIFEDGKPTDFVSENGVPRRATAKDKDSPDWVRVVVEPISSPYTPVAVGEQAAPIKSDFSSPSSDQGQTGTSGSDLKQPWEMTFQETVDAEESRLRKDYPEVDDEDIQYQLKLVKVQDWLKVLKKRAEEGFQLSDDVLDDVVNRVGVQGLQRTFRGAAEQRQYVPKIQRESEGFKQPEKNVLDKEIWERTKAEHRNAVFSGMTRKVNPNEYVREAAKHKAQVKKAVFEGKPVPANVLAEYPDLTPAFRDIAPQDNAGGQGGEVAGKETTGKGTIPDKPTTPKKFYFYRTNDKKGNAVNDFMTVPGKSITLPGYEGYDFFIAKDVDNSGWSIYEGKTGARLGNASTQKRVTEKVLNLLNSNDKRFGGMLDEKIKELTKEKGLSPRYGGEAVKAVSEPEESFTKEEKKAENKAAEEKPFEDKPTAVTYEKMVEEANTPEEIEHARNIIFGSKNLPQSSKDILLGMLDNKLDREPTPEETLQRAKEDAAGQSLIDFLNKVDVDGNKVLWGDEVLHEYRPGYYPTKADLETLHDVLKMQVKRAAAAKGDRTAVMDFEAAPAKTETTKPAEDSKLEEIEKSKGHVAFYSVGKQTYELYKADNGDLYKAPISNVIDMDTGNRHGRFEAKAGYADQATENILNPKPLTPAPKLVPDKPVDPKKFYAYRLIDEKTDRYSYEEVQGKSIVIPGYENLDTFIAKNPNNKYRIWSVLEGKSGLLMGDGKTQKEAVKTAKQRLDAVSSGKVLQEGEKRSVESVILDKIEKNGLSPRYTKSSVPENTIITSSMKDAAVARQNKRAADRKGKGKHKGTAAIFTPEELKDAVIILGYYTERGVRTLAAFTEKAIEVYGEPIRPHLDAIWKDVKATLNIPDDTPPDNTKNKKQFIEDNSAEGVTLDSGDTFERVAYGVKKGEDIKTRDMVAVGYDDAPQDLKGIHVGDSDYWKSRLNKDYGREGGRVIIIKSVEGDGLLEDPQYVTDPDTGDKAESYILATSRKSLVYGKDWVFKGEKFAEEKSTYKELPKSKELLDLYEKFGAGDESVWPRIEELEKQHREAEKAYNAPKAPEPPAPPAPEGPTKRTVVPPAEGGTSLQNSAVAEQRAASGLPPLREVDPYKDEEVLQHARDILEKDPRKTERLLDDLRGHIRPVSVDEEALLLHRMVQLENERDVLASQKMAAMRSNNIEEQAIINNAIIATMEAYQELTDITKAVGRDIARALRFRQRFVDNTYTLLKMEYIISAAVGRALNPADLTRIADLQADLAKSNAELKAALTAEEETKRRLAEVEAQKFLAEERAKKAEADRRSKTPSGPRSPQKKAIDFGKSNKLVTYERHVQNRERFKALISTELRSGLDPRLLEIAVEEGVYFLEAMTRVAGRKAVEYADWASRMTAELGDGVIPLLKDAWAGANAQVREEERTELIDDLQDVYEGESEKKDAEIGRLIKKIAANHIASGITELNPLIDATLADVADIIPEMTWEDVLNTFADYGRYRPLDKNALKAEIRDKRRQALQLSKLLALYKKQPLKKTGLERGTPSDTERELIKLVNEAKKEFGIETTDPETQLKSALDAVKTRLRNEIYDLEKQITTREKMIRERAPLKYDTEATRLKTIRDGLKATYDQIFSDPQADAAKKLAIATTNAEKSLAYYTDLLKRRSVAVKAKNTGPTSPELERIRQRRNMIRREVIKLRNAAKPKKSIEERVLDRLTKREAEYKRRMAAGDYAPRPRKAPFMSQRTLTAAAKVERIKREFDEWAYDEIMKNKPLVEKAVSFMANIGNVLKSLQYGGEVSSIGRQLFLGAPVEWAVYADAVKDTLRAWKDPNYAKEVEAFVETHPFFRAANVWANIQFTTAGIPGKNEFLPSKLPEKLPVIGQLYRRGDAAFNAPLNKQRLGLFEVLTKEYVREGKLTPDFYMTPSEEDVRVMKRLGGWINDLTGRSAVGKSNAMRQAFTFLNYIGGAPRYTMAKLKLTASGFGVLRSVLPGIERTKDANGKERLRLVGNFDRILLGRSAKALMKFAAFNVMVATAAYLMNPDDNEFIFDPRSSDFMKVRVGNQRYDFTVGIGAILRLFTQLATGERRDAAGRIQEADRRYLLEQFIKSKESPLLRMVTMLYTGEDFVGQPISKTKAITDSLLMLFLNDAWDSYKNSGLLAGLTALGAGAVGIGVQSYPETATTSVKKTQDGLAQAAYGKNWMDLSDIQQRDLRLGSAVLKDLELKKKQERQLEPYEFKQDAKEFEAGQRIYKSLSPENQKKLLDLGIKSINIGRGIGLDGFILNDSRFKAYEADVIRVLKGQDLRSLTQKGVENRINTAREIARRNILQKIRQGQL